MAAMTQTPEHDDLFASDHYREMAIDRCIDHPDYFYVRAALTKMPRTPGEAPVTFYRVDSDNGYYGTRVVRQTVGREDYECDRCDDPVCHHVGAVLLQRLSAQVEVAEALESLERSGWLDEVLSE